MLFCIFIGIPKARAQKQMFLTLVVGINQYILNGMQLTMDVPPEIVNGRTFVPIRLVAETFGADVQWDSVTRTVTIKSDSATVILKINSTDAIVNGKTNKLETAPFIKNGITMVPIRLISESLGLSVYWEPQKKLVYISAKSSIATPGVTDKQITIGSFSALSGPYSIIGIPFYHGFKVYINSVNDAGGIYGRKINVLEADDQLNPALTVPAVKKFVEEDKVYAVVTGLGTPGCLAVMDYLNDNGVPFIYQGSGSSKLAIPPKKICFCCSTQLCQ